MSAGVVQRPEVVLSDGTGEPHPVRDPQSPAEPLKIASHRTGAHERYARGETAPDELGARLQQQRLSLERDQPPHADDLRTGSIASLPASRGELVEVDTAPDDVEVSPPLARAVSVISWLRPKSLIATGEARRGQLLGEVVGGDVVELDRSVDRDAEAPARAAVARHEQGDVTRPVGEDRVQVTDAAPGARLARRPSPRRSRTAPRACRGARASPGERRTPSVAA